jgi:fluoride exporter
VAPRADGGPDAALLATIAAGGALGALGRWGVGLALPHADGGMPWATLVVNVSGAFAMGLLVAFLVDRPGAHRLARPFVGVGLLGGWTTFSALAVDVLALYEGHHVALMVGYLGLTFLLGTLAVGAGELAGRRAWPGP